MLFFVSAAVMLVSGFLCFTFVETKGQVLQDTFHKRLSLQDLNGLNGKQTEGCQSELDLKSPNIQQSLQLNSKQSEVCHSGPDVNAHDIQVAKL